MNNIAQFLSRTMSQEWKFSAESTKDILNQDNKLHIAIRSKDGSVSRPLYTPAKTQIISFTDSKNEESVTEKPSVLPSPAISKR